MRIIGPTNGDHTMRYTLWSHGILVGHTDLDIHTITPTMRQGFIEPTPEGMAALADATGVQRAIADNRRSCRARGGGELLRGDLELFRSACDRREAVNFELRDENGELFECEFMRVWDWQEMNSPQWRDDERWESERWLEGLDRARRAELEAEFAEDEELIEELIEDQERDEMFQSSWAPDDEPDPRWDTMRYHLQVHLKGCFDRDIDDAIDLT